MTFQKSVLNFFWEKNVPLCAPHLPVIVPISPPCFARTPTSAHVTARVPISTRVFFQLIHPFTLQTFLENLLCVTHCGRNWDTDMPKMQSLCPCSSDRDHSGQNPRAAATRLQGAGDTAASNVLPLSLAVKQVWVYLGENFLIPVLLLKHQWQCYSLPCVGVCTCVRVCGHTQVPWPSLMKSVEPVSGRCFKIHRVAKKNHPYDIEIRSSKYF